MVSAVRFLIHLCVLTSNPHLKSRPQGLFLRGSSLGERIFRLFKSPSSIMAPKRSTRKRSAETPEKTDTESQSEKKSSKKQKTKKTEKEEDGSQSSNGKTCVPEGQMFEKKGSCKIASWNVNGIRAWMQKGGLDYLKQEDPDIFCVQETKCSESKLPPEIKELKGFKTYFLSGDKDGYSGVGIMTKIVPLSVSYGIGHEEHDSEGRVITLEFEEYFLLNAYVPNSGRGLVRLDYRMKWDDALREYLCKLREKKSVILTGDLNVAHKEIDLKNPKTNKRTAGFTQEERDKFTELLGVGFSDSFRDLYPDREHAYTFWSYMMNARAKNVGWRLDYFVISENLRGNIVDIELRDKIIGSDHCPIVLHLK